MPEIENINEEKTNELRMREEKTEEEKKKEETVIPKWKPWECFLCGKSFTLRGDLNRHVAGVHDKLKPVSCPICDKKFRDKGAYTPLDL